MSNYIPPKRKPCPFCGSTNIDRLAAGMVYWLYCRDCKGAGPSAIGKADAVEAWNQRAGGEPQ